MLVLTRDQLADLYRDTLNMTHAGVGEGRDYMEFSEALELTDLDTFYAMFDEWLEKSIDSNTIIYMNKVYYIKEWPTHIGDF